MSLEYLPFGDDNAEDDVLLIPCAVDKKNPEELKPILLGRWGVGKTGTLLLQNNTQNEKLKKIDKRLDRVWYINEHGLDLVSLLKLKSRSSATQEFVKGVEKIWKIEITRIYALILYHLRKDFGIDEKQGHWKAIGKVAIANRGALKTVWRNAAKIIDIFTSNDDGKSLESLSEDIRLIINEGLYENVKRCLEDISNRELIPMIVVEPIETPTSELESEEGLAHYLIQALLNCWHAYFKPNKGKFRVKISIPWHRDITDDLDFPQKVYQHKCFVEWNKGQLKRFIEKRINYEFKRINKFGSKPDERKDLWYQLFEDKIINGYCMLEEDTIDYFLRHTHYRPRDFLRLVRQCVLEFAKEKSLSIDQALKYKIPNHTVKTALRKTNRKVIEQLIIEGDRRYAGLKLICSNLRGLPLPFSINDLKKRVKEVSDISFAKASRYLWESGIIGVVAIPNSKQCSLKMEVHFDPKARKEVVLPESANITQHIWTWFEYNYEGDVLELMDRLETNDCSDNKLVLHPKSFETFMPRYDKSFRFPIG